MLNMNEDVIPSRCCNIHVWSWNLTGTRVLDYLTLINENGILVEIQDSDGIKAGACFRRPKFTGFCEAFLEGK